MSDKKDFSDLIRAAYKRGEVSGWFEPVYEQAAGEEEAVPWARMSAHPVFLAWLEQNQPTGLGKNALVIGCGLGDDAEELSKHDFAVSAFDISPSAIAWARQRFPNSKVRYQVADLFDLPTRWLGHFDFVFLGN